MRMLGSACPAFRRSPYDDPKSVFSRILPRRPNRFLGFFDVVLTRDVPALNLNLRPVRQREFSHSSVAGGIHIIVDDEHKGFVPLTFRKTIVADSSPRSY